MWGFLIKPEAKISNLKITVIDNDGNSMFRYYLKPTKDSLNLVLLHRIGFHNSQSVDSQEIVEVRLDFYVDSKQYLTPFFIKVNGVFIFDDRFDLYEFFTHESFYFPEKRVSGNIY